MSDIWIKCGDTIYNSRYIKTIYKDSHGNEKFVIANTEIGSTTRGTGNGAYDERHNISGCEVMKNFPKIFEKNASWRR